MSGLEILGAVAAGLALAKLGIDVSKKVRRLSRNIKYAETETNDLASEVSTFTDILSLFSNVMEEIEPTLSSDPRGKLKSKIASSLVKQSQASLEGLSTLLDGTKPLQSPSKFGIWKQGVAQFRWWRDKGSLLYLRARFTVIREVMNLFVGLLNLQKWKKEAEDGSQVNMKIEVQERLLANNIVRANDAFEKLEWHHEGVEDASRMNLEALQDLRSLKAEIVHSTYEQINTSSTRFRSRNYTREGFRDKAYSTSKSSSRPHSWSVKTVQTTPTTPPDLGPRIPNVSKPITMTFSIGRKRATPARPSAYGDVTRRYEDDIETKHGLWNSAETSSVETVEMPPSPQSNVSEDDVHDTRSAENSHRMADLQEIQATRVRLRSRSKPSSPGQGETIRESTQRPSPNQSQESIRGVSDVRPKNDRDDPGRRRDAERETRESRRRKHRLTTLAEEPSTTRSARKYKISSDETYPATGFSPAGPTRRFTSNMKRRIGRP